MEYKRAPIWRALMLTLKMGVVYLKRGIATTWFTMCHMKSACMSDAMSMLPSNV